jgi:hypothetical protein
MKPIFVFFYSSFILKCYVCYLKGDINCKKIKNVSNLLLLNMFICQIHAQHCRCFYLHKTCVYLFLLATGPEFNISCSVMASGIIK